MSHVTLGVVVMVVGLLPVIGEAQTNFSGTWNMDLSRSESAHQGTPIGPVTLVITQTVREVSILTAAKSTEKLTYPLDGGESTINEYSANPVKVKAHWDGTRLVGETARNINDATVTTISVLALDPSGKEMTIKRTLTVQHGYQSQDAKNTGTGTDVFVKAKN
jgi:hypothetical protein